MAKILKMPVEVHHRTSDDGAAGRAQRGRRHLRRAAPDARGHIVLRAEARPAAALRRAAPALRHVGRHLARGAVASRLGGAGAHRGRPRLHRGADLARRLPRSLGAARLSRDPHAGRRHPPRHRCLGGRDRERVFPAQQAGTSPAGRSGRRQARVGQAAQALPRFAGGDLHLAVVAAFPQRAVRPGAALPLADHDPCPFAPPQRAPRSARRRAGARRRSGLRADRKAHTHHGRAGGVGSARLTVDTRASPCRQRRKP